MIKRLLIKVSSSYDGGYQIVPVNTCQALEIESDIGVFLLVVNLKNFDGSKEHRGNSAYNVGDTKYLDGREMEEDASGTGDADRPNLRLQVDFRPKRQIKGSELLFGNDTMVPIRYYVPTTMIATGLKFFTWFINKTIKGDIYSDKPYLYGLALNSFSYMSLSNDKNPGAAGGATDTRKNLPVHENLNANEDNVLDIPLASAQRRRFFSSVANCDAFVFNESASYCLQFDTNSVKMADSKYSVSIPTFGNRTFDFDASRYANEKLDNFNWVIKQGGYEGVGQGTLGLVINFALIDED